MKKMSKAEKKNVLNDIQFLKIQQKYTQLCEIYSNESYLESFDREILWCVAALMVA